MREGTVKFFKPEKGFGFITVKGGNDDPYIKEDTEIFLHIGNRGPTQASSRVPKTGDVLVFTIGKGTKSQKAMRWQFQDEMTNCPSGKTESSFGDWEEFPRETIPVTQTTAEMMDIILSAKPGDRLKVLFTDKTFDGDLGSRLIMILGMQNKGIWMEEMSRMNLDLVATTGNWGNFRIHTISLQDEFEPDYFIQWTIDRELLDSVSKI
jgi:cold shock CspA family protein